MRTILHQGRPSEGGNWLAIPDACLATYKELGYQTRDAVLRDDADQAVQAERHAAIEEAVQLLEREFRAAVSPAMVSRLRALKLKPAVKS